MGDGTLRSVLERDADAEVAAILAAADAEAAALRAAAETRTAAAREARVAARRAELDAAGERAAGAARREGNELVLEARWRFVDRVLAGARALFATALQGADGAATVRRLIAEAEGYLPPGRAVVRCAPDAASMVPAAERRDVVPDPAIAAGIRLEAADGSVVVDNTLEARLARLTRALAAELVRREGPA